MDVLTPEHIQSTLAERGVETEITFFDESTATSQQAADQSPRRLQVDTH